MDTQSSGPESDNHLGRDLRLGIESPLGLQKPSAFSNPASRANGIALTADSTPLLPAHFIQSFHVQAVQQQGSGSSSVDARSGTASAAQNRVGTPSQIGTPDLKVLRGIDRALTQVRERCAQLSHEIENAQKHREAQRPDPPPNRPETPLARHDAGDALDSVLSSLLKLVPHLDSLTTHLGVYPTLLSSLKNHGRRLEALENASFSNGPIEDVSEKIDLLDGRLIETEGKVDDIDKWRAAAEDEGSGGRRQRKGRGVDSSVSSESLKGDNSPPVSSSALMAAAMDRADLKSRLANLESSLSNLQSAALPSLGLPWEFEIVMLPWGRDLKGIWHIADKANHSSASGTQGEQAWTHNEADSGYSQSTALQRRDTKRSGWDGLAIRRWADSTAEWMSPRAPSTTSKAYERLRSRGLVRSISVTSNSARDFRNEVLAAFGNVIDVIGGEASSQAFESINSYGSDECSRTTSLGVLAPFTPLRKVHRDSRLQFLSRDEMISSTLWTAEFLAASVVMKVAGRRRLYVTHRDGYLQPSGGDSTQWTWETLRQLPGVHPTENTEESDAEDHHGESCWQWHPRFDDPPSAKSSISSAADHVNVESDASGAATPLSAASVCAGSPSAAGSISPTPMTPGKAFPMSPLSEFPMEVQSQHRRTISMPVAQNVSSNAASGKRRVVSYELLSPTKFSAKRRRISRSPTFESSAPVIHWTSTPRRSNPPSPFFSEVGLADTKGHSGTARGCSAPLAYATPHSGIVPVEHRGHAGQTENESDGEDDGQQHTDEAWEGVQDDDENGSTARQDLVNAGRVNEGHVSSG